MKFRTKKRTSITFSSPQEMYDDYKNREIEGIHDYQSKMIDIYMKEAFTKENVAMELPTGTGKTLIGLLIGEYRRSINKEKIVYLCPTNQLVHQTVEYANKKFGIKVEGFTGKIVDYDPYSKSKYQSGDAIAVTNYSSLFNVNSFFDDADIIILDDAHSAESYIASNWTLNISRFENTNLYCDIVDEIANIIDDTYYNRMLKTEPTIDDIAWVDKIPNTKLFKKHNSLQNIIDENVQGNNLRFSWSNIRNNLHACNMYISWNEIIIRPTIPPTLTHEPFSNAKQRIFMSATLGKSGELERISGIDNIYRLPMVKDWKNKTIGRKYFMFPNASFKDEKIDEIIEKISQIAGRSLMIVKDDSTRDVIVDFLTENTDVNIYKSKDIEKTKEEFIKDDKGFAVLANRFDGMDFPNEDCRMLILFDLPSATHLQEKFLITRMASKTLFNERINTRLIQALGRCTRSHTDYAAVCIFGDELMNNLVSPKKIIEFNPELQAEIQFGFENSVDHTDIDEYLETLEIFLNKNDREEWNEAEEHIIGERNEIIKETNESIDVIFEQLKKASKYEVKAQYDLWKKNYKSVISNIERIVDVVSDKSLKGYKGFWYYMAGCSANILYENGDSRYKRIAQDYFEKASKNTSSITWFNNLIEDSNENDKINHFVTDSIERLEKKLIEYAKYSQGKFIEYTKKILESLMSDDGDEFEKGHLKLGEILGYISSNPKGDSTPDPYWIINNNLCIVTEDKIYKDEKKAIPTKHVRQALTHETWIREKGLVNKEAEIYTVFISNSTNVESSAQVYGEKIKYLNRLDFYEWAKIALNCVVEVRRFFLEEGNSEWREFAIDKFIESKSTPLDFINLFKDTNLKNI